MPGAKAQAVSKKDLLRSILERALAEQAKNNFSEAASLYRDALKIDPQNSGILFNLGVVFFKTSHYAQAAEALTQSKNAGQKNPDLNKLLGASLVADGQYEAAEEALQEFLKTAPDDTAIYGLYLEALAKSKKHLRVLAELKKWQSAHPDNLYPNTNFYTLEADALVGAGEPDKARALLEEALAKHPDDVTLWPVLGGIYNTLRLFDRELDMHRRGLEHNPHDPKLISNYGLALANQNCVDEAIALFDEALAREPLLSPILVNRAYAHKKNQNLPAAIADLEAALKINPVSPHAHYALGCNYIQNEDYQKGWPHYEWFWHVSDMPKFRPTAQLPNWYGEDLTNKHILLYVDQGIGDTILFMRYIPLMFKRYKNLRMSIICEEKLHSLMERSLPLEITYLPKEKLKMGQPLKADYMAAFGSLQGIFNTPITDVPAEIPYLKTHNKRHYKNGDELVIGISWYTKSLDAGYKRSLDLQSFAFLKNIPNIRVIDLQYGDTSAERAKVSASGFDIIHDDSVDPWNDMQSQIDQIAACDLVISVDNTTVHAAGALGVPVWTLLPYDGYWRWHGHERLSTPWYPTMRLFRQGSDRDFAPVMHTIENDVKKLAAGDRNVLTPEPFIPRKITKTAQKTAVLLNDTSTWYHWGCTATSLALQNNIAAKGYAVTPIAHQEMAQTPYNVPNLTQFDDPLFLSGYRYRNPSLFHAIAHCDHLVINGEGTIHGMAPNAIRLLYLAYIAKTVFKKTVHIINHACFPEDSTTLSDPQIIAFYLKTYRVVDDVVVRDAISHQLLTSLGIKNTLGFDSLPLTARNWLEDRALERKKHVILAGSSLFSGRSAQAYDKNINDLLKDGYRVSVLIGAAIHKAGEDRPFCEWIQKLFGNRVDIIDAKSMDEWFTLLGEAALLVSGRFHYSIAAACLGTPFVAFEGNTPKLHALCDLLKEKAPLNYGNPDLSMQMTLRMTQALRDGPMEKTAQMERLDMLCGLALKNYKNL